MSLMSALSVGVSGLKGSQNAVNTTSHNLANVNTPGYVRQQVVFTDTGYVTIGRNSVYVSQTGLGIDLAEVRRIRDVLLDKAFRQENGREAFYERQLQATTEIEEIFGELEGVKFQDYLVDFWESIQEIAKTPSSNAARSALVQSAVSFIDKANTIYESLRKYQDILDTSVQNMVNRVNVLGKEIDSLNKQIIAVEAVGIEKANDLRDRRDLFIDELSSLVKISCKEEQYGNITVKVEGVLFVSSNCYYPMGTAQLDGDKNSPLLTPVWPHLDNNTVYNLREAVSTAKNTDIGALKALLLARGGSTARYTDIPDYRDYIDGKETEEYKAALERIANSIVQFEGESDSDYQERIKTAQESLDPNIYNKAYQRALKDAENSINRAAYSLDSDYEDAVTAAQAKVTAALADYTGGRNSIAYQKDLTEYHETVEQSTIRTVMAEFDQLINAVVEKINDLLSPNQELLEKTTLTIQNADGTTSERILLAGTLVLDTENAGYGRDENQTQGTEMFTRLNTERYEVITGYQKSVVSGINADGDSVDDYGNLVDADGDICILDENGNLQKKEFTYYVFNTKNTFGNESLYTLENISMNEAILQDYARIPLSEKNGEEDRVTAEKLGEIWTLADLRLTPAHNTQRNFMEYYTEFMGQIANAGNLYEHMVKQQETLMRGIEGERQGLMGVSSDEELASLIKFQTAYNASSRYITVIDQMLEHLVTRL